MDFEQTITAFSKRDISAFKQVHEMYSDSIFSIIFQIVRNRPDAEEVCQDVFLKAWKHAHTYDVSKGKIFTWLLNIAKNTAIDRLRTKDYKQNRLTISENSVSNFGEHQSYDPNANTATIGLEFLINGLKEKNKKVIVLSHLKGYTHRQIAQMLNMSVGSVKHHMKMGIQQLQHFAAYERAAVESNLSQAS